MIDNGFLIRISGLSGQPACLVITYNDDTLNVAIWFVSNKIEIRVVKNKPVTKYTLAPN